MAFTYLAINKWRFHPCFLPNRMKVKCIEQFQSKGQSPRMTAAAAMSRRTLRTPFILLLFLKRSWMEKKDDRKKAEKETTREPKKRGGNFPLTLKAAETTQ